MWLKPAFTKALRLGLREADLSRRSSKNEDGRTETAYKGPTRGRVRPHDKAGLIQGKGKCGGCAGVVHVLIWGDIVDRAPSVVTGSVLMGNRQNDR
ncbi:MAG: hypothetical protein A2283_22640 [Lentisphaerae bacterium RIFOXYA12_FULL_48_11]|nr:MAG: hypothetical protein A2283_22640 [Lentisphaerae bacterium RIFOXYA12_FULL_48_11]